MFRIDAYIDITAVIDNISVEDLNTYQRALVETKYNVNKAENGDFLCFDMMRKECHDE